ncbi:MAG: hypothetical protein IT519_08005 [Burkholderiales bacterium]|nr:hypothetical protein [Burkholderiales bacterium]
MRAKNGESTVIESYNDFLAAKFQFSQELGHAVQVGEINPILKPHQRDIIAMPRGMEAAP